jgi:hypothetical protein
MPNIVRENILASSGNQSLFPAGTAVYLFDASGPPTLNGVLANQLVIYNYDTNVSLSPGETILTADKIVIAQGVDLNGDGLADTLRGPFGDKIYGCNISGANVKPPVCGLVDVLDISASCIRCDEDYSLNITVEDDLTQNQYPYNRPAVYTFSVNAGCCACDSCTDGVDCQALFCLLADQINGKNTGNALTSGQFLQRARNRSVATQPFYAYPLYANDYIFCLSTIDAVADTCDNCNYVEAINGITINAGDEDEITVNFTNTVSVVGAERLSLISRLPRIVQLINAAFEANGSVGSAVITRGLNGSGAPCCDYQLRINSCVPIELFDDDGEVSTPLEPCVEGSPFEDIITEGTCKGCSTPTTTTPTCGLRLVAKPVDIFCNCYTSPDTPRGWFSRKLGVNIGQDSGFTCGSFHINRVQVATIPEGFGYEWQVRAANQSVGGMGRDYNPWGWDPHGRWGSPLAGSRGTEGHLGIVCAESYCVYSIEHVLPNADISVQGNVYGNRGRTIVLIPFDDSVTQSEFEAIINPYLLSSHCPNKVILYCVD